MILLYFLLLILFIIFIFVPFPIKFFLEIKDSEVKLSIYKHILLTKKLSIKTQKPTYDNKNEKKHVSYYLNMFKLLKNRFLKPSLKYTFRIDYDLPDPCHAAVIKGVLDSLMHFLNSFLYDLFKISHSTIAVTPKFKNTLYFYFSLKGIIYINLVKITIIGFKMLIHREKEVQI